MESSYKLSVIKDEAQGKRISKSLPLSNLVPCSGLILVRVHPN